MEAKNRKRISAWIWIIVAAFLFLLAGIGVPLGYFPKEALLFTQLPGTTLILISTWFRKKH
ncbi:hypothetical protein [Paenibacillus sp. YAF4_2]|uniref:hypothetical protein n=1 Tax=Paenibacillus sp. YAF4_2 TaxID=3233085 RepID=UPI003F9ADE6F